MHYTLLILHLKILKCIASYPFGAYTLYKTHKVLTSKASSHKVTQVLFTETIAFTFISKVRINTPSTAVKPVKT